MPDAKISALPSGVPATGDVIPFVDNASGITRKATKADLRGSQGSQGSASTVAGPTGPTGADGVIGSQGSQGSQGSASTVAGPTGPTGADGARGSQGSQGSAGDRGSQGSVGSAGATGGTGFVSPRVLSQPSAVSVAPNADLYDQIDITAMTETGFFDTHTGTPVNGQKLIIRLIGSAGNRNISFTGGYTAGGVALPTSITQSKHTTLGFMYNTMNSFNRWMLVAKAEQSQDSGYYGMDIRTTL